MTLALDGYRMIDFTQVEQGPCGTQVLADFGMDVIKVEPLGRGDILRAGGMTHIQGLSPNFLSLNRNKRSIAIDLRQQTGKDIIYKLAAVSDVVAENFRPQVMDRLKVGYEDLKQINPGIIYACASGYGQTGPYALRRGQDLMAQAMSGVVGITGYEGQPPVVPGTWFADYISGMLLAQGVLIALIAREKTGEGQKLESCLLNGMLSAQMQEATYYMYHQKLPQRRPVGAAHADANVAMYALYEAQDQWIALAGAFDPNPLAKISLVLGIADLSQDPRFATREKQTQNDTDLRAIIAPIIKTKPAAEWVRLFSEQDILCAPVNDYSQVWSDPQVLNNEMVMELEHPNGGTYKTAGFPLKLYGTPAQVRHRVPRLGEHTDEILEWLGYTGAQMAELREQKVVE